MKKAAISSIIAIILGYLGTVFGAEIMNWPQLGSILAIVVMGSAIITSLEKDKQLLDSIQFAGLICPALINRFSPYTFPPQDP